jgi:5'-nucleotidase
MRTRRCRRTIVGLAFVLAAACVRSAAPPPSERPLEIVITNDDGIEAPGIAALAEALRPLGTVTVAAPDGNRSGASHGVTSDRPIVVRESVREGLRWYAIDALPATCIRLAVEQLLDRKPDVVVSGINRGENLGTVTFYSATVGAAREAVFLGVPAIAVNLVASRGMDFRAAGAVTAAIVRAVGRDGIAPGTLLNVNVPALSIERIRGVRLTRQDLRAPVDFFGKTVLAEGVTEYKPGWKHLEPGKEGTDIWAVRNGYVSVSVFGIDQSASAPPAASLRLRRLERLSIR